MRHGADHCTPRTVSNSRAARDAAYGKRTASIPSTQCGHVEALHVGELLVLAAHRPAERVVRRAASGVDRPRWRQRDLAVAHDDVLRGIRGTEQMEDDAVRGKIEVQIDFGATHMG